MTRPTRNLLFGIGIALVLVTMTVVPTIAGVSTWKWALGGVGLLLFIAAERQRGP